MTATVTSISGHRQPRVSNFSRGHLNMRMKQDAKSGIQRMALKAVLMIAAVVALGLTTVVSRAADPLPSWNDGPAKQSIIAYVEKVTKTRFAGLRAGARTHRDLRQ